jgi:regulation of enolase protein 1 (concanavalin A-like superfamily)
MRNLAYKMRKYLAVGSLCLSPLILSIFVFSACSTTQPRRKTPASSTPAPIPPEAVKIDKPVNVSFSTYSKEWPVGWQWIDPDEKEKPTPHDVRSGVLRVKIPNGKDLNGETLTAPRYVKPITGDFQVETRVKFSPKENYQGAGLLIYKDDNNYLRFERAYGGLGGGGEGLRIDIKKGSDYDPLITPNDIQTEVDEIELKIVRIGKVFTAYWRADEESEWREAGEFVSDYPETILAGVVACNTAREVTAEFAYIRLLPAVKP